MNDEIEWCEDHNAPEPFLVIIAAIVTGIVLAWRHFG